MPTPKPTPKAYVRRRRQTASYFDLEAPVGEWNDQDGEGTDEDLQCVEWTAEERQMIEEDYQLEKKLCIARGFDHGFCGCAQETRAEKDMYSVWMDGLVLLVSVCCSFSAVGLACAGVCRYHPCCARCSPAFARASKLLDRDVEYGEIASKASPSRSRRTRSSGAGLNSSAASSTRSSRTADKRAPRVPAEADGAGDRATKPGAKAQPKRAWRTPREEPHSHSLGGGV